MVDDTFKGVSVAVPLSEDDNVHHKKVVPMPLEHEEKKEESTIPCEVEDIDVNITVQSQNEQHADNDEDLSAEDLLCFAWQIAQGMVRILH